MPVLAVREARKSFGSVAALRGPSIELRAGEVLGLLGPNVAGKTTLVRAIAGRVRLDAGEAELFGRRLAPSDPRPSWAWCRRDRALPAAHRA